MWRRRAREHSWHFAFPSFSTSARTVRECRLQPSRSMRDCYRMKTSISFFNWTNAWPAHAHLLAPASNYLRVIFGLVISVRPQKDRLAELSRSRFLTICSFICSRPMLCFKLLPIPAT